MVDCYWFVPNYAVYTAGNEYSLFLEPRLHRKRAAIKLKERLR